MAKQNDTSLIRLRCCPNSLSNSKVLLVINNKPYQIEFLNSLNLKLIQELNIFKGNDAIKKYGSKANEGVIVISTKKKVKLISALSILKRSKIDQQYLTLALSFKGNFLDTPYIFTERHKKYQAVLREEVNLGINSRKITSRYLFIDETNVSPAL